MNGFDNKDVNDIEIELVGECNLKCPLCSSVIFPEKAGKRNIRPLEEWTKQIDEYTNLKSVCISGICSEPTLYPYIIQLIDYFVKRRVSIELFTNASTHDENWWNELNRHLTGNDLAIFTICGSTQEIHQKYRVGQNLDQMMRNIDAFKRNNLNKNDCIQYILFEYNKEDFKKNMKPIIDRFSHKLLIQTPPYAERFLTEIPDGVHTVGNQREKYMMLVAEVLRRRKNKRFNISCRSKKLKYLAIDQFGNEYPCFLYRLFSKIKFDKHDFSSIENFDFEFCYDCDEYMVRMMQLFGIESMV